ncbi:hypothetical protein [Massilia brevitalea]|uniref:hypothetical protein n=1 Tax=Massilia brevitalea TaxID=442526 RepID=UPI002738CB69|nr:hypothetical protein [Massilia brevitalea]
MQATIERLTEKTPCPRYLRDALNKYLYREELFDGASSKTKQMGQLKRPDTDNLVRNLLELDGLFCGDTSTVTALVTGKLDKADLNEKLDRIERGMRQRLEIYSYWLERLPSARAILADGRLNLKEDRLDHSLTAEAWHAERAAPVFALHALRIQEESEAKVRMGPPSAAEYVERAEAYLALNDHVNADRNACLALEQDARCARAWFLRVAIALRGRDAATRSYQQKRIESQEIAEPCSAHEQWAREQADEAADDVMKHQRQLDAILPHALSCWPQSSGRRAHPESWRQVRSIFIDRMFSVAVHDIGLAGTYQQRAAWNGFEPEWELQRKKYPYLHCEGLPEASPFTQDETRAIVDLLADYDSEPEQFFMYIEDGRLARELRLLHLRYVLRLDGGAAHWDRLHAAVTQHAASHQVAQLMRDASVARIWQMHYCRNLPPSDLAKWYAQWNKDAETHSGAALRHGLLRQFAFLYHHQFARQQFHECGQIAASALGLFDGAAALADWFSGEQHPHDEAVTMPLHRARYWDYLAALAAVEQRKRAQTLAPHAQALLADTAHWCAAFSADTQCLWTESEEYEDGGGEDWPTPPYGVDLRTFDGWK